MENKSNTSHAMCPVWSSVTNKSEGKMYGILLESVQFYVVRDVGEETWHKILTHAGIKNMIFTTHTTYKDELMISLAKSCAHVTKNKDINEWMTFFGTCFVEFCSGYGYDKLLRVTGRNYRDFLHGIDNIHEIIRFSYPRMQSPSFLVLSEDFEGCILLYQSKRSGFKHYVKGQLQQCAKKFYDVSVSITIIEEMLVEGRTHVKFRLDFDNSVYTPEVVTENLSGKPEFSSITGDRFLQVFPFCIVFNNQLIIQNVGPSMAAFLKGDNLIGCNLRRKFHICRPLIPCIWSKILRFKRVIFELEYIRDDATCDKEDIKEEVGGVTSTYTTSEKTNDGRLLLRGEMKYIREWDKIAFLCKPLINDRVHLQSTGLFINDLNMFDMSRDMVMAGWQYASQLEFSIEKQRQETEIISENMSKIEEWKKKSNSLLYSMIPEAIAERLKSGEQPIDTCEVFDNVTIMFNYMVGFADICANATPMEIVTCINDVFILFDKIVDNYNVFKVETLGDAVYMVAGGVPDRSPDHALNVAGLALELQEKAKALPGSTNLVLNTRIGMHTGSVVGGVVGRRMPQYCLFGDTVNTASRMQTYSMPGRIHLSEPCFECLKDTDFVTVERGTVNIKGKGEMKTYWLAGKAGEQTTQTFLDQIQAEKNQAVVKQGSYDNALDLHGMHASTSAAQISIDLEEDDPNSPRKVLSKSGSAKNLLYYDKSSPRRKLFRSNVSGMFQVTEEVESDPTIYRKPKVTPDVPVISISEVTTSGIQDTLVSTPSVESVSFFINTDENSQECDVLLDNETCNDDKGTDVTLKEQIRNGPIKIFDTKNKNFVQNDDVLKEFDKTVEDDSCVNFSGCPLLSSLFKLPVLGCSTCTYVNKDDEIMDQTEAAVISNTQPISNTIEQINTQTNFSACVNSNYKSEEAMTNKCFEIQNPKIGINSSSSVLPSSNTAEINVQNCICTADNNIMIEQGTTDIRTTSSIQISSINRPIRQSDTRYDCLQLPNEQMKSTTSSNSNMLVPPKQSTVCQNKKIGNANLKVKHTSSLRRPRSSCNKSNVEIFPSLDVIFKRPRQIPSKCSNRSNLFLDRTATKAEKTHLLATEPVSQNDAVVHLSSPNKCELDHNIQFPTSLLCCQNGKCLTNGKTAQYKPVWNSSSECKTDFIKTQSSNSLQFQYTQACGISTNKQANEHTSDINDNNDMCTLMLNGSLANNLMVENGTTTDLKSDSLKICSVVHIGNSNKGNAFKRNFSTPLTTFSTDNECPRCNSDPGIWTKNPTHMLNIVEKTQSNR